MLLYKNKPVGVSITNQIDIGGVPLDDFFEDIADAIREKDGTTAPINPTDFPERIRAIKTGQRFTLMSPYMRSNTLPSPYIVSASSIYASSYPAWCAFDGDKSTAWAPSLEEATGDKREDIWLQFNFGTNVDLFGVELTSRGIYTYQMPMSITLSLSDDGINYKDYLTIVTGSWGASETRLFLFQEKVRTKIVRFKNLITKNDPSLGSYYYNICIADVKFALAAD